MALPKNTAVFRRDAPRYIDALMRDFGLTDVQAAGFPGNFGVESNGFTAMQELRPVVKGSKGGLGPAQWTGPRRRSYEAWLKRKGAKPGDFEADYGFLFRELSGAEKGVLAPLRKARTIEDAVRIVMATYERPGIPHLDRRVEWGRLALEAYRTRSPAPKPKAGAPAPAAKPEVRTVEISAAPASWWERLIGVRKPTAAAAGVNKGDATLFRAQNQLLGAGYTEVGDPDGLWGPSTKTAIDAVLREQFPAIAPPKDWPLSDEVLAAIAKAGKRQVAEERAAIGAREAIARGSTPARAAATTAGFGIGTLLTGLGGLVGLPDVVAKASEVSDKASDLMGQIQGVFASFAQLVGFVIAYRWPILIAIGAYFALRGLRWLAETVIMLRTGTIRQTRL